MVVLNFYLAAYGYPAALVLFLTAAVFALRKTGQRAAIFMVVGFAGVLLGHVLQNYGTGPPTYTAAGDALFEVPAWHALGQTAGILGTMLASVSLLVFIRKTPRS